MDKFKDVFLCLIGLLIGCVAIVIFCLIFFKTSLYTDVSYTETKTVEAVVASKEHKYRYGNGLVDVTLQYGEYTESVTITGEENATIMGQDKIFVTLVTSYNYYSQPLKYEFIL